MYFKKLLSIFISLLILLTIFTVQFNAQEQVETYGGATGDCTWEYNPETYTLTISGDGNMDDYTGTNLPPWYGFREETKTVIIENGVKTLGGYSFYMFTALEYVVFNDTLEEIHFSAFRFCSSLEEINVNDKVHFIEYGAFSDCDSLKSIHLPINLTTLQNGVFFNLPKLESIYIPYNVQALYTTFNNCPSLTTVHLSSKTALTNSGSQKVFMNCNNIKDVYYYGKLTELRKEQLSNEPCFNNATFHYIDKIQYEDEGDSASGTTGDCVWNYDSKSRTLTISGNGRMQDYYGIETIPWNDYSDKIVNIVFADGVTHVGREAFPFYSALENIYFSDTVESIEEYAFQSCGSIEYINVGKNVTSIGHGAFSYMNSLKEIKLPENLCYLDALVCGCANLKSIKIPDSIEGIPCEAFWQCSGLKSISFGTNIKSIGYSAFSSCTSLTDIYFTGTKDEWNDIAVDETENEYFLNATVHFNEEMPTEPFPVSTIETTPETYSTDSPETTEEHITESVETTVPETTTEFITKPEESTAPETTSEPVTEPIETTTAETTAVIFTEPEETTIEYIPTEPATNTEITTAPVITTAAPTAFTEPNTTFTPTEFTTAYEQTTLPIIIPTESLSPLLPTTPIITEPIETKPQNIIPPKNQNTKTNKKSQKITAKSYSVVLGNKPFPIKAKAKGKISFKTKSKKIITLSKNGKVTIKSVGIAYIRIHAAGNKLYKSADKIITVSIKPPKLKLLSKSGGTNKKYTIYFKKIPNVSGYELLYKAKGEKKYKKIFAKKNSNKFVIKNLKYTKHTIKARAYKKVSKAKLFGAYIKASFGPSA